MRDDCGVDGARGDEDEGGEEGDVAGEDEEEEALEAGAHAEPG